MNPRTKQGREELRVLCEKATRGPWEVDGDGRDICGFTGRLGAANSEPPYEITENNGFTRNSMADDAVFIAASRTALPEALDALEAAEAVIEAARVLVTWNDHLAFGMHKKRVIDALTAYDAKKGTG